MKTLQLRLHPWVCNILKTNKWKKKTLSLALFGGCQGKTVYFWKLENKGKEWNTYFPFSGHTFIQRIIDEGWFLCRDIFQLRKRGTEWVYEHFATFNELMDLGNDYQWAWNPVDEELIGNLTMDGLGWQLLNPLINLNVKERETARPRVPPDDRAYCHLWCGLAKNIELVSDQASGLLPVHRRPRRWRRVLNVYTFNRYTFSQSQRRETL